MKNLISLITDKPSMLHKCFGKKFILSVEPTLANDLYKSMPHNLYIISDERKKINDYVYDAICKGVAKITNQTSLETSFMAGYFKIILTTDPKLIADGIQDIDDTFLEWFVKNPSCEEVEVENIILSEGISVGYEIEIPKEEPKQEHNLKTMVREMDDANYEISTQEQNLETKYSPTDKAIADIRNKMGYVANLLSLLQEPPTEYVLDRIKELLPKSEESIEWLRQINAKDYEHQEPQRGITITNVSKQEIAKRKHRELSIVPIGIIPNFVDGFLEGFKEAEKTMYTLEEIAKDFLSDGENDGYRVRYINFKFEISGRNTEWEQNYIDSGKKPEDITFLEWFEQFKKK